MIVAPNFRLTIVHESMAAEKRAKRFSDQFIAETNAHRSFELNLWSFEALGTPEVRNAAASAAAVADVVILSMSGTVPLPPQAVEWIEMWTWLIDHRRPTVVALFADPHRHGAAIRAYLRRSALGKNLDFLPVVSRAGESVEGADATGSGAARPAFSLPDALLARNNRHPVMEPSPYE